MSGHSKWSKIKRQKESNDRSRGLIFSKLSRLISMAVVEGGGMADPEHNIKLRFAMEKAQGYDMPKENIKRAIEKGAGPEKSLLRHVRYEAFGPHGVALLVTATTDNANRTTSEIKNTLEKHGGKLGNQGSVAYLFQECGITSFDLSATTEEAVLEFADRIGALDFEKVGNDMIIYFPFVKLGRVKEYLKGLANRGADDYYRAISSLSMPSHVEEKKVINLVEALENLEDVHAVFTNMDISHL
ncbi:MAG: YebC/PmpR family DNA-binding transcriptional regulator [bacterium]|nr:YebC/PmpR family DNA-binding transcriptional regulator [bacterium]